MFVPGVLPLLLKLELQVPMTESAVFVLLPPSPHNKTKQCRVNGGVLCDSKMGRVSVMA